MLLTTHWAIYTVVGRKDSNSGSIEGAVTGAALAGMGESEMDVEVRSLDGQSTRISVSSGCTVEELKTVLKESFPPAKMSPNFHLFYQGIKMRSGTSVMGYLVDQKGFIVLVPFTRKNILPSKREPSHDANMLSGEFPNKKLSEVADSAWSDLMEDLSVLTDRTTSGNEFEMDSNKTRFWGSKRMISESSGLRCLKGMKKVDSSSQETHDRLSCLLHSNSDNAFSNQSGDRLHEVLESVNCLSDYMTSNCLLLEEFGSLFMDSPEIIQRAQRQEQCACPMWLKEMLKCFTFLNIYSGFIQMRGQDVTFNALKEALKQLNSSRLCEIGRMEIQNLSLLCPKIVMIGNHESGVMNLDDGIVITNSSSHFEYENESGMPSKIAGKRMSVIATIRAIEKRDIAFKKDLWGTVKCFLGKTVFSGKSNMFSLNNVIKFVKEKGGDAQKRQRYRKNTKPRRYNHCKDVKTLLPMQMVEHLRRGFGSNGQMVHVEEIGARPAVHVELPDCLTEMTKDALNRIGISQLYSHQAESIKASLTGNNVVVATSTSSGKSLCYNLPVLEELSSNSLSCAIYLFPTKALAQDQLRALLEMTTGLNINLNIGIYDGDTPQEQRLWLCDNARVLITNPDMLHMTILPRHGHFERILSNLRFIIIDEAHAYKGAFGCHTALIFRRLQRICHHVYGSNPLFIFSTATSANPKEHAMELVHLQNLQVVQNDGSPCGQKFFILWNPPLCFESASKMPISISESVSDNAEMFPKRSSSILEASYLFAEMVQHGLRCIAFCKTRKLSELVLCYTREILEETAPYLVDTVGAYRGGYTAQDRRAIESGLFGGKLCGVAATNALELGIDVGHVDATLHLGFPGSVASLWQQVGRSGRREKPSLAVYIAFGGPLDQYFMKFPKKLFGSPIEHCIIDFQNKQALEQHVTCAAFEHPLSVQYDEKYFGSKLSSALKALEIKGYLSSHPSQVAKKMWNYIGNEKIPSHAISIRAIQSEKYKVLDAKRNEVLEEIEEGRAFFQVYEGAVYMHQGKTYLIKVLDLAQKTAFAQEADLKYYTKTRDYTDIHVTGGDFSYPVKICYNRSPKTSAQSNPCTVTTSWFGFYRIWRGSNKIFDTVDLFLPKCSYNSQAVWIRIPHSIKEEVEHQFFAFRAGQHAASHALLNVVPLYVMCNASDMGSECANPHDTRYTPERLLLYDKHPGGTGLSAKVQVVFVELLTAALELVTTCNCSSNTGCPNCIQIPTCGEYNEVLDKNAAIMILEGVMEVERSYFDRGNNCTEIPTAT